MAQVTCCAEYDLRAIAAAAGSLDLDSVSYQDGELVVTDVEQVALEAALAGYDHSVALAAIDREVWKAARAGAVAAIKVTTSAGNTFDGDEVSQQRMARAIVAMTDGSTVRWVLADNTTIQTSAIELKEALRLAGAAQASIWVMDNSKDTGQ